METGFSVKKWEVQDNAFHLASARLLQGSCFQQIAMRPGSRVFAPLGAETLDVDWLLLNA
tara:strand:+ start:68 stop:247 length:180 start_codon:yes stop_codon:yes gene_type:complete